MAIGFVPAGQHDSSQPGTKCLDCQARSVPGITRKMTRPSGTIEPILLTLGLVSGR